MQAEALSLFVLLALDFIVLDILSPVEAPTSSALRCGLPKEDNDWKYYHDCGGENSFINSYLSAQQSVIFRHVGVPIYIFEVESRSNTRDLEYYTECLNALRKYSLNTAVFLLIYKMDLVRPPREVMLLVERKAAELRQVSREIEIQVLGRASTMRVSTSAFVLTQHLTKLAEACSATEVVLFERTTFLVITTSETLPRPQSHTLPAPPESESASFATPKASVLAAADDRDPHALDPTRYERTSKLIKVFKHLCARVREEFRALEMQGRH